MSSLWNNTSWARNKHKENKWCSSIVHMCWKSRRLKFKIYLSINEDKAWNYTFSQTTTYIGVWLFTITRVVSTGSSPIFNVRSKSQLKVARQWTLYASTSRHLSWEPSANAFKVISMHVKFSTVTDKSHRKMMEMSYIDFHMSEKKL